MPREYVLHRTRTALGRSIGQPPDPAPPARFWTDDYSNLFSLLRK